MMIAAGLPFSPNRAVAARLIAPAIPGNPASIKTQFASPAHRSPKKHNIHNAQPFIGYVWRNFMCKIVALFIGLGHVSNGRFVDLNGFGHGGLPWLTLILTQPVRAKRDLTSADHAKPSSSLDKWA